MNESAVNQQSVIFFVIAVARSADYRQLATFKSQDTHQFPRSEVEHQLSNEKLLMKAAVNMPCVVCPEDACRSFEYVGSQHVAQVAPRDRLAT